MVNTTNAADNLSHVFKTFMGLPPDTNSAPVCGASLSAAWTGRGAKCAKCARILRAHLSATEAGR